MRERQNRRRPRIYNRASLPKEVRDLYNWAPGPVGYWNMDEKTGQTVNDISENGLSATLGLNSSVNTDDPTWTTGKYGAGLSFDGGDYVAKAPARLLSILFPFGRILHQPLTISST